MSQLNLNVVGATELMFISSILIPTIGLEIPFLLQLIFFENEWSFLILQFQKAMTTMFISSWWA